MKRKRIVLGIIHTSLGELQWIVPYFYCLSKQDKNLEFVLLFFSKSVFSKAQSEEAHLKEFSQIGRVIHKKDILPFLLSYRKNIVAVYKDFWPIHRHSLASAIRFCCPKATMYLYPHANAIYSLDGTVEKKDDPVVISKHDHECFDYLLLNTQCDIGYWRLRVPQKVLKIVGSPAYQSIWTDKVRETASVKISSIKRQSEGKKIVAVFTRPADSEFLDPNDYQYLIRSIIEVFVSKREYFLVFKQHPREDSTYLLNELKEVNNSSYCLSDISPMHLCSEAYCSISFWSSTITDSLAMKCPAVEFFRYHQRGNDKWYPIKGSVKEYKSFYSVLGLCLPASNKQQLEMAIRNLEKNRDKLLSQQLLAMSQVFGNELRLESLPERHEKLATPTFSDWLRVAISTVKSYF
ncbi:hypothetical protein [uncultured Roseivirga sp.]|uniref:hypothetical protein n=1 Tax=uncultured Roseivirga sp. TaxID=543088 RepID=UPI00258EC63F|nr:hypothetical protein [uncultured Roseivirga sp.]MEC7754765.1 hypothetical protein [Bacteroidota bacterium]